ncbi:cold shock domain-containing protein [Providencia sneebia]|uniref:Cold-shock protein n=1 Tax=Providencia sneebia DSM 19967 TaxID=1141660 RepID=K8WQI4_9GAMM|nr:cold shock domain-containing protein [Providencia sneebia]EKT58385.1 cold-shock protein [Providencia sneebia DSM 19967]
MQTGTVKWFSNAKGFGFICPDSGGEDIFAHYTCIQMEGYRTLRSGQKVNFSTAIGPKGNHANAIIPIADELVKHDTNLNVETASLK